MVDYDDVKVVDQLIEEHFPDVFRRDFVWQLMRNYPMDATKLIYLCHFQNELLLYYFDQTTGKVTFNFTPEHIFKAIDFHAMSDDEYQTLYDPELMKAAAEEAYRLKEEEIMRLQSS